MSTRINTQTSVSPIKTFEADVYSGSTQIVANWLLPISFVASVGFICWDFVPTATSSGVITFQVPDLSWLRDQHIGTVLNGTSFGVATISQGVITTNVTPVAGQRISIKGMVTV